MKKILIVMLCVIPCFWVQAQKVKSYSKTPSYVMVQLEKGLMMLHPLDDNAIRVQVFGDKPQNDTSLILSAPTLQPEFQVKAGRNEIIVTTKLLQARVNRNTGLVRFLDKNGKLLLSEAQGGRTLIPSQIGEFPVYSAGQTFDSPDDEFISGTGQFQDGYLNIRGLSRRLTQVNTQIAIPYIYSNKGYGLLWHNYGLTEFNPSDMKVDLSPVSGTGETINVEVTGTEGSRIEQREFKGYTGSLSIQQKGKYALLLDVGRKMARKHSLIINDKEIINFNNYWLPPTASTLLELEAGNHTVLINGEKNDNPSLYYRRVDATTTFHSPVAQGIDYVVFAGTADESIASYRRLTGEVPLMPRWSLGYIHCRERFSSQKQLIETAREFRKRNIPVDMIVQDWQYWGKYGWNAMKFDEKDYPDPAGMVDELHSMNMRLMLSVWAKADPGSEIGKELSQNNYFIPGTNWVDFFNPAAAACYWENFSSRLLKPFKIDAWWQDATEPENDDLAGRMINNGTMPGEMLRNAYPLFVNRTVYEGLRKDNPNQRVFILTRSAFPGQQKYAAATWSGDVGNDWETLRRQITAGLSYSITGQPYWTTDCGGFFRPENQYADTLFHERFLRWFQFATFCPLQRVHGYKTDTEFWNYGSVVETEALRYLKLRYRLLPYLYSHAAAITFDGYTLMRPLVMDFPTDKVALQQNYVYMFGTSLLVAPVVQQGIAQQEVYLPDHKGGWFDFWDNTYYRGSQTVKVDVPIWKIPVFVKSGSIIPLGPEMQYSEEIKNDTIELRVYTGCDGAIKLYSDDGISYGYEQGELATIAIRWDEGKQALYFDTREGSYPDMNETVCFKVYWVNPASKEQKVTEYIKYTGRQLIVRPNNSINY